MTSPVPDEVEREVATAPTERLVVLTARLAKVEAEMNSPRFGTNTDPAVARLAGSALRQFHRTTDSDLRRYTELVAQAESLRFGIARCESATREGQRHRFTADEVNGAKAVRSSAGWWRVVRCSAKSVTVETGYSWTERIPLDKILEVRS